MCRGPNILLPDHKLAANAGDVSDHGIDSATFANDNIILNSLEGFALRYLVTHTIRYDAHSNRLSA